MDHRRGPGRTGGVENAPEAPIAARVIDGTDHAMWRFAAGHGISPGPMRPAAPAPVPSTERGAWTCRACGFRGFWHGGPHCFL